MATLAVDGLVPACTKNNTTLKEFATAGDKITAKTECEPLAIWLEHSDCLIALIGEGDCRDFRCGWFVTVNLNVLLKVQTKTGEDPLAGFILDGAQKLLREHYKPIVVGEYDWFQKFFNEKGYELFMSELFEMCLRGRNLKDLEWIARIRKALARHNPKVHIQL